MNLPLGLGVGETDTIDLSLELGDRLLVFTDGVTDANDAEGRPFGVARLGDLLAQAAMADELPAETVRRLTHSVLDHAAQLCDDASLLMLGWPQAIQ